MTSKTTLTSEELAMIASAALKVAAERDALRADNERLRARLAEAEVVLDGLRESQDYDTLNDLIAAYDAVVSHKRA